MSDGVEGIQVPIRSEGSLAPHTPRRHPTIPDHQKDIFILAPKTYTCIPFGALIFWPPLGTHFFLILVPFWCQLASQNGPKIHQKSIQEPSNTHPNIHLIIDHFFHWFLMDFSLIFDPKINENSIKNQSTNHPNNTTTKWCRYPKNNKKPTVFYYFCYVGYVILYLKINKIRPNILQKTTVKTMPQLGWIWMPTYLYFWWVLGAKLGLNS